MTHALVDDALVARGRGRARALRAGARSRCGRSPRSRAATRRSRRSRPAPTTSRSSRSRPARPASRRAACTSTATCSRRATRSAATSCAPQPDEVFAGTPPLAFTFGLGGHVLFPLRFGASTAPCAKPGPGRDARGDRAPRRDDAVHRADRLPGAAAARPRRAVALDSLRVCVSAGEPLPASVSDAWFERTGIRIIDGIGSTEMLHIFIASRAGGRPRGLDRHRRPGLRGADRRRRRCTSCPPGEVGRLAVRGADGLPLPRRPAPVDLRRRRLEPHRRRVPDGRRRLLLVPGADRRHDRLVGLQHLGRRGRGRAARASGRRRVRGRRRRRTRSAGTW